MPQISFFYGIYIWMNFADHQPPHFHAWYGDYKVIVNIKDGIVKGEMPGRALPMVLEWLEDHRKELMERSAMPLCLQRTGRKPKRVSHLTKLNHLNNHGNVY
jgi:hypothetical protein